MPLTGAEKTRRYREKLKRERPEEYAAQCRRSLERVQRKRKKISEMTPAEAEEQRKKWRQDKAKSNSRKRNKDKDTKNTENQSKKEGSNTDEINIMYILNLRKKYKALKIRCKRYWYGMSKIKAMTGRYKKRYQRLQLKTDQEIQTLKTMLEKYKAREEVLEFTLKKTYKLCKTHQEKRIFKKLVDNAENKSHMSKMLGLVGKARTKKKKMRRNEIPEITNFFVRVDNSRITAGKKETRTKNKTKIQIRYLVDSLVTLFKKYKEEGGNYGFITFYKNKPFYVLSPHLKSRETCLCIKHSNLEFLHTALKKKKVIKDGGVSDALQKIVCEKKCYNCMYSKCQKCKNLKYPFDLINEENASETFWYCWERQNHTFTKKDGNQTKTVTTQKTMKTLKTGNLKELKEIFENNLKQFKKHHYNMQHQQLQYRIAISDLKEHEVVIVADFSENYETKLASEIQSMHFGASKNQITLHTGMIYWQTKSQSFCTLAENNEHQPAAIWAHLAPILKLVKETSPSVNVIHFFSDGPTAQYRQKHNFYLLDYFMKLQGFSYATWSFFEAGHGKSVADGIGGCIKRALDTKVCHGIDISNAEDAYNVLRQCLKVIKIFLIPDKAITEIKNILPQKVQPLKGTLQLHQIITQSEVGVIMYRHVSCFCGLMRGRCQCYAPQIHRLISPKPTNAKTSKDEPSPSTSNVDNCLASSAIKFNNITTIGTSSLEISSANVDNLKTTISSYNIITEIDYGSDSEDITEERINCDLNINLTDISLKPPKIWKLSNANTTCNDNNIENLRNINMAETVMASADNNETTLSLVKIYDYDDSDFKSLTDLVCSSDPPINLEDIEIESLTLKKQEYNSKTLTSEKSYIFEMNTSAHKTVSKPIKREPLREKNNSQTLGKKSKLSLAVLECYKCTCSILGKKVKCIACKNWICDECAAGACEIDYICEKCLED